ncbi:MAG TPA: histidine kinase dimerization/phospho-acceptor domain-containing protein, partial [Burkholderiaceae bacterium]|nr:histidine kinase dimerization/phospho-acceptor domain-containing protein [Burkholderiaceae bacterium]
MNDILGIAGPVTGRRHAFRRALRLPLGLLLALQLIIAPARAHAEPDQALPELRAAEFSADGGVTWSHVALPDTWSLRGLPPRGSASYRLQLTLAHVPTQMWALRADRISSAYTLYVNDRLADAGSGAAAHNGRPIAHLIDLPPDLLHAGTNDIRIELDYRNRGGLSALALGPLPLLQGPFARHVALTEILPECLNIAGAAFGLFMCAIWWRRRGEAAIGWFGVLCMLVSVRNYCYFVVDGPALPDALSNWAYYVAQVASALLFGAFALALSGERLRWFERTLQGSAVVLLAGSVLAGGTDLQTLRALTYPLVIALSLVSLWLVVAHARRVRQHALLVLPCGLAMVLLGGVHDYLYQQGHLSVLGGYWMPYATPVALFSFALVLVNRLVQALADVELLNASLERRVADRTHALEVANASKTRFLAAASHDMRQPVVTIGLLVGLVREQLAALPAVRPMLDRIHEAVASLEALLKGLMDLSRLESG